MTLELEQERQKLAEKKRKFLLKEKLIKAKEKRHHFNKLIEIGKLAERAAIDHLNVQCLLGAFLEISQNKDDSVNLERWQKKADSLAQQKESTHQPLLSIKFKSPPDKEISKKLKGLKLEWNRYRKEFCGYADKAKLESFLQNSECRIEVIE